MKTPYEIMQAHANALLEQRDILAAALRAAIEHAVECEREHSAWIAPARAALARCGG
jgi:hypothetical protein